MVYIMDFKKKVKDFGYKGRPLIKGKLSKPYVKYALTNRNAPLPKELVRFNKKIVERKKLQTNKLERKKERTKEGDQERK